MPSLMQPPVKTLWRPVELSAGWRIRQSSANSCEFDVLAQARHDTQTYFLKCAIWKSIFQILVMPSYRRRTFFHL